MEREVVVSEDAAASSSSSSSSAAAASFSLAETRVICRVCQKQFAQYTCPRCNARYCSLPCYKGHSVQCTESFMRENVMDELKQMQPEDESKKKMHTGGFRFAIALVDDIISLLTLGGNALVCALCDFRRLIHIGERMLKAEKLGKAERSRSTQKLRAADRKLYFMTCWVHEQPNEAWSSLARLVEVQKASLEELDCGSQFQRAGRKNDAQSKVLIEEI
uniref:HIT-type domain-containing protein n=1 Tax=Oryza sativa subsp. japonica TaxID=39947 RepID=Q9FWC3_ORYSJ|nr:hypothetical protein [Oryza sativa Japonica Group]